MGVDVASPTEGRECIAAASRLDHVPVVFLIKIGIEFENEILIMCET